MHSSTYAQNGIVSTNIQNLQNKNIYRFKNINIDSSIPLEHWSSEGKRTLLVFRTLLPSRFGKHRAHSRTLVFLIFFRGLTFYYKNNIYKPTSYWGVSSCAQKWGSQALFSEALLAGRLVEKWSFCLGLRKPKSLLLNNLLFFYIYYTEMLQDRQSEVHRGLVGCWWQMKPTGLYGQRHFSLIFFLTLLLSIESVLLNLFWKQEKISSGYLLGC